MSNEHNTPSAPSGQQPNSNNPPKRRRYSRRQFLSQAAAAVVAPVAATGNTMLPVAVGEENSPTIKTTADVAWSRLPQTKLNDYYRGRGYLKVDPILADEERRKADNLRFALSTQHYLYPFWPDQPGEMANRKRAKVEACQRAALHELVDELGVDDVESLFEIAALYVNFPVDWPKLAARQQEYETMILPYLKADMEAYLGGEVQDA